MVLLGERTETWICCDRTYLIETILKKTNQYEIIIYPYLSLIPSTHLNDLYSSKSMENTSIQMIFFLLGIIYYDDACHLKRFAQNPVQRENTDVAEMEIACIRFHFRNHIDGLCRFHCNPLKSNSLKVNTSINKFVLYNILVQSMIKNSIKVIYFSLLLTEF